MREVRQTPSWRHGSCHPLVGCRVRCAAARGHGAEQMYHTAGVLLQAIVCSRALYAPARSGMAFFPVEGGSAMVVARSSPSSFLRWLTLGAVAVTLGALALTQAGAVGAAAPSD